MNAKQKAIELRQAGYSYRYIHEKTGLAKSTLSYHLATVPFTPNAYTQKEKKQAQQKSAETKHRQKVSRINTAEQIAQKEIGKLSKRDIFMAGIALYIGEGSKTQNIVRLVNSDVRVIGLFLRWLEVIGVPLSHVKARIHAYPTTDFKKAQEYWSNHTHIPASQFQSPCIDRRQGKDKKRAGTHEWGTLHLTVGARGNSAFGSALSRKITAYMDLLLG